MTARSWQCSAALGTRVEDPRIEEMAEQLRKSNAALASLGFGEVITFDMKRRARDLIEANRAALQRVGRG
jgi:hypothetical protein